VQQQGELEVGDRYLSLYKFAHILFQQYLYQQLDPGQRRHLHLALAQALAELYAPELDRVAVALAHHFAQAGRWQEALPHVERAGDLARERASLDDAAAHYRIALDHWPAAEREGQARLLRKLGECQWMLGQLQEAIEYLESSYNLFRRLSDKQGAGATQRLLGRVYWEMGQPYKANQCYQQALTFLQEEAESEELGWALASMAAYHMHVSDYDRAIELGEEALALARRLNAEELLIQCLCDVGSARSGQGDWDALDLERESLARALTLNRPHDVGRAYVYLAEGLIYLGSYEEARTLLQEALSYTRRTSISHIAAAITRFLAELDWLTGNWASALEWLEATAGDSTSPEEMTTLAQHYQALTAGRIYNDLGLVEPAQRLLSSALRSAANSLDPRVALLGELARSELLRGQQPAAISAMHEILEWTDQARYLYPNIAPALLTICRAPLAHDLPAMSADAHYALQQLQRLDAQYRTPATAASLLEAQGYLALLGGETGQAITSLSQAAQKWQHLGHPYDQARALNALSQAQSKAGVNRAAALTKEEVGQLLDVLSKQLPDRLLKPSAS
jgi:tetratricopeptide (TPR) repeat protein